MPTQIRAHRRVRTRNTWVVAIQAVAAQVLAAVHRARSQFASSPEPLPAAAGRDDLRWHDLRHTPLLKGGGVSWMVLHVAGLK